MSIENKAKKFYNSKRVKRMRKYDHPKVTEYIKDEIDFIRENIKLTPEIKALEIGAGSGYFSYHLDKYCRLLVTDMNREILWLNPVRDKEVCDASKLPFDDNSFDVVFSFNVLHHLDYPQEAIKEARRVSKNYVVLLEPNIDNIVLKIFSIFFPKEWGTFRFSSEYFRKIIKNSYLEIIEFRPIGRLFTPNTPLPLLLLKEVPYSQFSQLNLFNIAICKS